MSALSDLPELIGFFSYSRDDDEDSDNALTRLRTRIQNELRAQLGRSRETLRLWQDQEAIPAGALWSAQIEAAIQQSVFFVPIISPRVVHSKYCSQEFDRFLQRERDLGRSDLVFPILYIGVEGLRDERLWQQNAVLQVVGERQYVDWRMHRHDPDTALFRKEVEVFCESIVRTIKKRSSEKPQIESNSNLRHASDCERKREGGAVELERNQEKENEASGDQFSKAKDISTKSSPYTKYIQSRQVIGFLLVATGVMFFIFYFLTSQVSATMGHIFMFLSATRRLPDHFLDWLVPIIFFSSLACGLGLSVYQSSLMKKLAAAVSILAAVTSVALILAIWLGANMIYGANTASYVFLFELMGATGIYVIACVALLSSSSSE